MADEIDLPGAGPVKRQWVYVGGALVAGILVYAYWQRARNAGPGTAVPVDPALAAPSSGSTTPGLSNTLPTPPDPSTLPPTTNPEWVRRCVDSMQNIGYAPDLVASVLGKYLARQPLVPSEQDLVRTAQGLQGRPPVGDYTIIPIPSGPTPTPTPTPTPGGSSTTTASVHAGWHVDQWVQDMRAAGHAFSLDQFLSMNPGKYTWANNNGFIDLLPPDKRASGGPAFRVFGADTTVTIPA